MTPNHPHHMAKRPAKPKNVSARDGAGKFAGPDPASARTRFGPGNQAAKGHGRPPDRVKKALADLLDEARSPDFGKDSPDPARRSLSELALDTIEQAMLDRDDGGNITPAGVNAARLVLAYRYGMPKQTTEINVSGHAVIATVRGVMAKMVVEDARLAEKDPHTPNPAPRIPGRTP